MADRAAKRMRRKSTEYDESEGDGWDARGNRTSTPTASSTRPRRGTANQSPAAAVIQRSSPEETRQSIHLTVKSSPNKLRQATGGAVPKAGVNRNNIVAGKRASRSSRVVREIDSEEDDDDDEEEDEDDAEEVDAMDVDDESDENEVDAEGDEDEDMDAEGDEDDDMEDTPAPRIAVNANRGIPVQPAPAIKLTKAQAKVEASEMAMDDDDDDDLSDPDSELEEEDAEGEDEEAEGEEDDDMGATPAGDMDSDEDLSRDQTPDVSKMTKRQRALINEEEDGALLALSNEAQKKKHLTAEEHAMRRAEMARRRKNLSEKRNEEEKLDTINRLLKKQPPKRGRKSMMNVDEDGDEVEHEPERANPLFTRYIQNAKGTQLAVPDEWLQAPVGNVLAGEMQKGAQKPFSGRMVEEVA